MAKNTVFQLTGRDVIDDPLTRLLREGARRLIEQAVETELQTGLGSSLYQDSCRLN